MNSHRSTSIRTILELIRYSANDCILGLPAMFHACGWGMPFIAMTSGAKIVLNNTYYDYTNCLMNIKQNDFTLCERNHVQRSRRHQALPRHA